MHIESRKLNVAALTEICRSMISATTVNIMVVVEIGDYFVPTRICTITLVSFLINRVDIMKRGKK